MAAACEFLINLLVTRTAVGRRKVRGDDEAIVILPISSWSFLRLMAVEAIHPFRRVFAHLVFVSDGMLLSGMAFDALAGGFHKIRIRLVGFDSWTGALDKERAQDQAKAMVSAMKTERKDIHPPSQEAGAKLPREGTH